MAKLQIFIAPDCWSCGESQQIAADLANEFPNLLIELLDLEKVERPENVFAVPTYVYDGDVIFLGNPTREELSRKLAMKLDRRGQQ